MRNMRDYLYNLATDKYKGFIPAMVKVFLFIVSVVYGMVVRILIFFYRFSPYRLDCKVISVGNITLGGTGKTSLVEYIARYLRAQGRRVAILSRGYGRQIKKYDRMGDEPLMLSKKLEDIPIIVNKDRIRAAKQAIKDYSIDTVILDDGFQQWRIIKDLEVVTVDSTNPFGNRHLIPRGILRQPLSSLRRVDMFIITKTNLNPNINSIKDNLKKINPKGLIILSAHEPRGFYNIDNPDNLFNNDNLKGKTITLFSGIGDPASFENLITSLGIKIGLSFRFGDHHNYKKEDLDRIIEGSQDRNINTIITTEKDTARIYASGSSLLLSAAKTYKLRILVLRIEIKVIEDEQKLHNRLLQLYSH